MPDFVKLSVPVEEILPGDRVRTPRGRVLTVERVDRGDEVFSTKGELLRPVRYFIRTHPWGTLYPRSPGDFVDVEREQQS